MAWASKSDPNLSASVSLIEDIRALVAALGPDGRKALALLGLLTLFGAAAEYATLVTLMALFQNWAAAAEKIELTQGLVFVLAALAAGGIRFAILVATQRLAFGTGHRLLNGVQRRVLARPWTVHATAPASGPLMAIEQVENVLYGVLLPFLQAVTALVLGCAILAALIRIDTEVALLSGGLISGLFLLATLLVRPRVRRTGEALMASLEARIIAIQQHGGAMRELILSGTRSVAAERFRALDRQLASRRAELSIASSAPRLVVETIALLALTMVAWWLAERSGGLATALPTLAALGLGAQRLLPLAQTLSHAATSVFANRLMLRDLSELLSEPDLSESDVKPPLPFLHHIRLSGVKFAYPGRNEPALEGINLVIRRGERVALAGRNGSGKSTLSDLVMGLLQPQEGAVLVDGEPLLPEQIARWQRNIAHVPQVPFLADCSIAENIAFMESPFDRARVLEAASTVGLHDMIAALPKGFDSRVGERGVLLSGGQRQRLALARALYRPAPLLVLDEATSALDPESETLILRVLDVLQAGGTTILLIAHRSTMLEKSDRVIWMEAGRLVSP
jgi:ATP-binding cassette subfamily B protein